MKKTKERDVEFGRDDLYYPDQTDANRARERKKFIDPEKGPTHKNKKK